ncbi:iron-containing alcohol dehydrogenase [Aliidiomarina sp.]|uniref:iron-containing alcohol dehydrogenase n=1 Tax=Aliidiomarina sp. TaxID=1872439 RepID=UPI003A4E260B
MVAVSYFKSAQRLITGQGASYELPSQLRRLNMRFPLIVTDTGVHTSGTLTPLLQQLADECADVRYEIFDQVPPEPEVAVVEQCCALFNAQQHDSVIAIGGGSAMDIAKCVAVLASCHERTSIYSLFGENKVTNRTVPLICMPTTAGTGSEVTNIAILADAEAQVKKGIVSDYLLPDVAIVSPELTLTCPPTVTAASGVDALVHAIEAYISNFASPITDALALQAMSMIYRALPKAYTNPQDQQAREDMATGSLLAGLAFGNAGVGAVHALAYPLGGRYHMAHGVSNALMLPYVMEWNKIACVERMVHIAQQFGFHQPDVSAKDTADWVIAELHRLCREVRIPQGLHSFEIPQAALPQLAAEAIKVERLLRNNPRVLNEADILQIYQAAY